MVTVERYDVPEPGENEVQIRVAYAGLAYADVMLRKLRLPGLPKPPFTPGADLTGTVERVGSRVRNVAPCDRVAALTASNLGAQAQFVNVDVGQVFPVPKDLPLDKAVCLLVNYLTAYQMLADTGAAAVDGTVNALVHGGSGGVGSALLQLLLSNGHRVFSTASSENAAFVNRLGATAIDYRKEDFVDVVRKAGVSFDFIFDPVGGTYLRRSLKVLAKGGTYVGYGFQEGARRGAWGIVGSLAAFMTAKIVHINKTMASFQMTNSDFTRHGKDIETLFRLFQEQRINPVISESFPIMEAPQAHLALSRSKRQGKILIQANE